MIKKLLFSILLCFSVLLGHTNPTDEGMWLPILLKDANYAQMKKLGLKLKPEQIYDINKGSLKDAIVWFNGGCTGEIISQNGLLLTNHHCGYGAISSHSTVEDNILDNGFWAKSYSEEKKNDGMFASVLVRMEDVSAQVMPLLMGLNGDQKAAKIAEITGDITKKATEGTHYEAIVRDIFKGNQYILFVYEKFTDIRLVGTPPQSVGKFGGDTDNWMWPRHTGDFSMFRIYANKENKPATYSVDNVPYKPKKALQISLDGVQPGDFAMIMGFPGRTNRYETSMGIKMAVEKVNPSIVKLRQKRLEIMKEQMDKDVAVRLQLSSRYAQIANYWKYFIGQTEQLVRLKVYDQKKQEEAAFLTWAANKEEYRSIFSNLEKAYADYTPISTHRTYLNEGIFGSLSFAVGRAFTGLEKAMAANDEAGKQKAMAGIKANYKAIVSIFNANAEKATIAAVLNYFYTDIPQDQHPAILKEIMGMYPNVNVQETFANYASEVMANSMMTDTNKINAFLAEPTLEKLLADPAYKVTKSFSENFTKNYEVRAAMFTKAVEDGGSLLIKGMMEMDTKRNFYPDANSTFRMTYGSVRDYDPKDGVHYKHYTTLNGVEEKYIPGDAEFDVPAALIDLNKKKEYGVYGDKKTGQLMTCFITDNDITGGNSGSPVMNGKGELIGLAFDGNWEAMSGDIYYDDRYKRTINVDIRYVLFLIDKFAGATHIVNEMELVKGGKKVGLK